MSKQKSPSIPEAPSFQADPNVAWSQDFLKGQSNYLINGLTTNGGNLSGLLGETVNLSPDITRLAIENLQAQLAPSYRTGRQDLINTLEANNQLTSSTTGSSLQNYENDYQSQLTAAGAQAAIEDINRALANRVSLYGLGLNTGQSVGTNALSNQNQTNQFALQNYENQVAAALMSQPKQTGGLLGGLTGAIGGGISGGLMTGGNPLGIAAGAGLGGFSGYTGAPGTGGSFLTSGASLYGSTRPLQITGLGGNTSLTNTRSGESISDVLRYYTPYGLN